MRDIILILVLVIMFSAFYVAVRKARRYKEALEAIKAAYYGYESPMSGLREIINITRNALEYGKEE